MLSTLEKLDYVRGIGDQVEPALHDVGQIQARVDEGRTTNDAKQLAIELAGHVPVTFGAGVMAVMARRVKDQWNENAKNWSSYDTMSELNHNAVVGFPNPAIAREALRVLLLRSDRDNPRHKLRFDITSDLLDRTGMSTGRWPSRASRCSPRCSSSSTSLTTCPCISRCSTAPIRPRFGRPTT
ncbi:MAG: hypothetical protein M3Z65_00940 [Chloroflexota bacterium]|nr:hypothetical protein [Chloroflexota bacterium]